MASLAPSFLSTGGLARITSRGGGSETRFALSCLSGIFERVDEAPLLTEYYAFIADEGFLYPPALRRAHRVPLSRLLLVKVQSSEEVWKVGLEAIQTGIFSWILLRPSRACPAARLRQLQLQAERLKARVLVLGKTQLPHWMFRVSLEVPADPSAVRTRTRGLPSGGKGEVDAPNPVFPKWFYQLDARFQRGLSRLNPQSLPS